ncbi:MAG: ferredoxin family protein [Candidatus Lutibacillus vidarii]|jgi:2-oxoglutarate ferredoxin oxidoreductase subunit delta|nr:ferredoxin family protein [Candidatus Lutibacillus vidarii]HRB99961.1 ferredoxin family protein [Dermatophilaceae bacterium]
MATTGTVTFNRDICKGCGLCVVACATHLLELDEAAINRKGYHPVVILHPEQCNGCANCALMCPDQGITVTQDRIAREGGARAERAGQAHERRGEEHLVHA